MEGTLTTKGKNLKIEIDGGKSIKFPNLTFVASACKSEVGIVAKVEQISTAKVTRITDEAKAIIDSLIVANELLF